MQPSAFAWRAVRAPRRLDAASALARVAAMLAGVAILLCGGCAAVSWARPGAMMTSGPLDSYRRAA